ncbi:dicarboxylate/amino acid:cation symporter [Tepidanaerobacter sp. GT38]|nr:dicarboxylate/amino acid:cation symporter [Tepidanaerobacter sp. GT38]
MSFISFLLSIAGALVLYKMRKNHINFGITVLTGMFFGIAMGTFFKESSLILDLVGKAYVSLIKMLVIPLVMTSIISSITTLKNPDQLKRIGVKSFAWLLSTTAVATAIGIVVAQAMNIGAGISFTPDESFKAREIPTFSQVFLDMLPTNPIQAMAEAKILPIIVFSIWIAAAIIIESQRHPEAIKPVKEFIASFQRIMFRSTKMVISLTPYGVYGLITTIAAKYGLETILPLLKFIAAVYIACILQLVLVHASLVAIVAKVNPIKFFQKMSPALMVAFSTQSSYGTLPVTIRSLVERVKVSEKIASFTAPLGATVGMNACGGLYPAIVAVFVARIFDVELTMSHYLLLIGVTTFSSIGIAGVPGTASIVTTVVLTSLKLPIEGLAIVMGVDVVVDMMRTLTNVAGASVSSLMVASSEEEFDRVAFNQSELVET